MYKWLYVFWGGCCFSTLVSLVAVFSNAAVFGDTNLELPSFRSNRSLVEVHVRIDPGMFSGDHKQLEINIELPLHARYQVCNSGRYHLMETVDFPWSSLE